MIFRESGKAAESSHRDGLPERTRARLPTLRSPNKGAKKSGEHKASQNIRLDHRSEMNEPFLTEKDETSARGNRGVERHLEKLCPPSDRQERNSGEEEFHFGEGGDGAEKQATPPIDQGQQKDE